MTAPRAPAGPPLLPSLLKSSLNTRHGQRQSSQRGRGPPGALPEDVTRAGTQQTPGARGRLGQLREAWPGPSEGACSTGRSLTCLGDPAGQCPQSPPHPASGTHPARTPRPPAQGRCACRAGRPRLQLLPGLGSTSPTGFSGCKAVFQSELRVRQAGGRPSDPVKAPSGGLPEQVAKGGTRTPDAGLAREPGASTGSGPTR